jgi:ribosome biogenesis GTPase
MNGTIIKGIGGFYYVDTGESVYECRARGLFRLEQDSPIVGDYVEFLPEEGKLKGYITAIRERTSRMLRPPVANVDLFALVVAASAPKPDLLLCDKLLLQAALSGVAALIVVNKSDEATSAFKDALLNEYSGSGAKVLFVSAKTGYGLDALSAELKGRITCFAGQSAVGKSSIINALVPGLSLKTGGLSKKTERGRHTTRHAELLRVAGGYVVDTPGFSLLELLPMEPGDLCLYYPEMKDHLGECRFPDCLHKAEPNCAVKDAVSQGRIPKGRYERYLQLLDELIELEKRKYD